MNQMSAQDAMFLHVENDVTPMHIGGVSIFEGPPPTFARPARRWWPASSTTRRATARRSGSSPSGVSEPVWVDDPLLRPRLPPAPLRRSLRRASDGQLRTMAAPRVLPAPGPRPPAVGDLDGGGARPTGRWALLSKVHHCMVDGVAATDLMSVMFDDDAATAGAGSADAITGRPGPSPRHRAAGRAAWPDAPPTRPAQPRHALRAPPQVLAATAGMAARARRGRPGAPAGHHVAHRDRSARTASGAGPRSRSPRSSEIRAGLGGTVNDVVLDDHHERLPRPAGRARRGDAGPRPGRPHDGPGVRTPARRARGLQQPRVGGVRAAARRASTIPRARLARHPRADGRDQASRAGGRR